MTEDESILGIPGVCPEHGDGSLIECNMCGIEFCAECQPGTRVCGDCSSTESEEPDDEDLADVDLGDLDDLLDEDEEEDEDLVVEDELDDDW